MLSDHSYKERDSVPQGFKETRTSSSLISDELADQ